MSSIHVALQELKLLMVMLMKWKQLFYMSRSRHTKTLFLWQQYFSLLCFCYNSLAWNVNTLNNCRCTSQGWCCPLPPMGGPHPWIMRYFSAFFFSLPPSSAPFPPFLTLNSFTEKKKKTCHHYHEGISHKMAGLTPAYCKFRMTSLDFNTLRGDTRIIFPYRIQFSDILCTK